METITGGRRVNKRRTTIGEAKEADEFRPFVVRKKKRSEEGFKRREKIGISIGKQGWYIRS